MALKRKNLLEEIGQGLSFLQTTVENSSALNLHDLAVTSEDFFARLLNAVFDLELENLNRVAPNHPAIDLGDRRKRECFQITAQTGKPKIQATLGKFLDHRLHEDYSRLRILVLGRREQGYKDLDLTGLQAVGLSFSPETDIITIRKLLAHLHAESLERIESVHRVVVEEIQYPGAGRPSADPNSQAPGVSLLRGVEVGEKVRVYLAWLARSTARVTVPGLGVSLPTGETFERYLAAPHQNDRREPRPEPAIDVLSRTRCLLVQGAAGAGKSTLVTQLANTLAKHGDLALRLRLPLLLRRLQATGSIDRALAETAADGSPLGEADVREFLGRSLYLLADGLDECGHGSATVAAALATWSISHPDARVLVTSRGSLQEHPSLAEWSRFRLHPLTSAAALLVSGRFLEAVEGLTASDRDAASSRLSAYLKKAGGYDHWTQTPLAVGLLVALAVRGGKLETRRTALLDRVFELLRSAPREGRTREHVEASVLDASIDELGWALQSDDDLGLSGAVGAIGRRLEASLGGDPVLAHREAERAVVYWEAAGLLERVGGGSPQLCFVHRQFQEFAAARALRRRPPQKIVEHVARVGRVPGWQEPLVLAAGLGAAEPLVQALVESDDPSSPLSLEALTAARAELETGAISPDRADLLASALEDRMKSPVPLLAYEAGELAVRLAREAPSSFARIARGLSAHTQEWTRAIGWTLRAVTKDLETEELGNALERGILDDFVCRQVLFRAEHSVKEASTLRTEFARTAIAWLLEQEDAMANKVLRSVCVRTDFPVGLAREFRDQLVARGLGDPLKIDAAKLAESVAFLPNMIGNARAGEIAFLESVLAACGPGPSSSPRAPELEPDRSPLTLRRLATSIGLNQHAAASDLDAIRIDEGKPILEVVIRGAVVAMGLDRSSLRSEAELALAGVSEDRERRSSLWWMGYGESEELDWDRASAELRPSSELLARGLHHPSRVIAVCALHLLAAGSKDEGIRAVRAQLGAYRSFGLLLATHACLHWGEPAIVAILERCEARLDPPTESMLELLPEADAHQDRVRAILHRGLLAGDTKVAASAARGLSRLLPLGPTDQEHIRSAFEYWLGSEPPEVIDYVVQHSPRPDLVRAGLVAGAFQPADLVDMLSDSRSDVKGAAREALAELAGRDSSLATELVDRIVSGELPPVLLEALAKGQALPHAEQSPVQLLKSPQSGVRRVALEILARGAELPVASANQVWELLEDPAPEIRNIAARLLRDRSWERPET